ncbi:A24 family peptidase [Calycomorphotria hydatis]|nr:A24 family peptidase [Calycomorphotria hydatis]
MPESMIQLGVLLTGLLIYTIITTVTDLRYHRIPNKVTVPMFAAGWVYQLVFAGLPGLADGALGFLAGFGILFVLWMIGVGGGGDVKLMGGISVWLGLDLTLQILGVSVIFVIVGTVISLAWSVIRKGFGNTTKELTGEQPAEENTDASTPKKQRPRIMAFALPVALATWTVLAATWVTATN